MAGGQAAASGADAAPESPFARQLRQGFRWLRFEPDLEAAYRFEHFRDGLRFLRAMLVALTVLILAAVQIDHFALPAVREFVPDIARLGVMVPLLALGFGLTFLRSASIWYPRVMVVLMFVGLSVMGWIALTAWQAGEDRLFVRMVQATIAVYFVVGLPFRSAFVASLAAATFFCFAAVTAGMPAPELTHYLLMLFVANVLCASGAYKLEHTRRTAWLEGKLLAEAAMLDGLTGIANRRRFDEHLGRAWHQGVRENRPVSLLFADIDFFKKYNDRYGHQAGDEALKALAGILSRIARRPLDLAARFGGEEFAIVLFGTAAKDALRIGETALEDMRRLAIRHQDSAAGGVLTVSIGIATVMPTARRTFGGLVQLADQALYAAKDGGRNQVRMLEAEYEQMKTGYFSRHLLKNRDAGPGQ